MLCSRPQTLVTAGRPQGGAESQLQRQEEGVVVLSGGCPPAVMAVHEEPPAASEAERLGALSSRSITGDLPCPHLLGRALRTGTLCEFPGVTRHPQRSQSVLCLPGPPHPLKSRIQATGGERAAVPVELWNPRRGRGTKSGSISI